MKRRLALVLPFLLGAGAFAVSAFGQAGVGLGSAEETREALQRALQERETAQQRAQRLESEANRAGAAAEKTARQAAALAARIQESEATIAVTEARQVIIERQRKILSARLAERQMPVVRLTAALQRFSRRPLALTVMRPGSVKELVYTRAMLSSTLPEVQRRTAALRDELERGKALEREANQALTALREGEKELTERQKELATLETRQRIASRQAKGYADQEAERALALAEEARDLDTLVAVLDEAGSLRELLALLPGPIMRPPRPSESQVVVDVREALVGADSPPPGYQLPVAGRTVSGFGAPIEGGALSKGLTLSPRAGAQVVAPASGRVAFAGPYRGYGRIVIIEHDGGWTSLITGLARLDVDVGEELLGGAPLGVANPARPAVTLELRHAGEPVNPLDFLG